MYDPTSEGFTYRGIPEFGYWLSLRGKSDCTVRSYQSDLYGLHEFAGDQKTAEEFDQAACKWLGESRKVQKPKTTCRRLTSLRAWTRYAKWSCEGLIDYTPPNPGKPVPHPIPEGISAVVNMIDGLRPWERERRALVTLCGLMGLRVSEARVTPVEAFDLSHLTLTIRGKGDKVRVLPISDGAWWYLKPAVDEAIELGKEYVVNMPDRTARDLITRLGKKVSETAVSSHDLRATFATTAYNRSKNIRAVQELLGHASSHTTEGYIQVKIEEMRGIADILDDSGPPA